LNLLNEENVKMSKRQIASRPVLMTFSLVFVFYLVLEMVMSMARPASAA